MTVNRAEINADFKEKKADITDVYKSKVAAANETYRETKAAWYGYWKGGEPRPVVIGGPQRVSATPGTPITPQTKKEEYTAAVAKAKKALTTVKAALKAAYAADLETIKTDKKNALYPPELLPHGGFEETSGEVMAQPIGWHFKEWENHATGFAVGENTRSGKYKLWTNTNASGCFTWTSDPIAIVGGKAYEIKGYYETDFPKHSDEIRILWQNSAREEVGRVQMRLTKRRKTWNFFRLSAIAPARATLALIEWSGWDVGWAAIDDLSFKDPARETKLDVVWDDKERLIAEEAVKHAANEKPQIFDSGTNYITCVNCYQGYYPGYGETEFICRVCGVKNYVKV